MSLYLHNIVSQAAEKWPANTALTEAGDPPRSITYQQLDKKIRNISTVLLEKGLQKGERAGLVSKNSILSVSLYFAISRAGGIAVPFNHTLKPSQIAKQANDCAISALYVGKGLEKIGKRLNERIASIRFAIEGTEESAYHGHLPALLDTDPVSIIYTSGTTRSPLGATLSHKNIVSNNEAIVQYLGLNESDKVCCVLPFYYIYGLSVLFSHLLAGATVVLEDRFMYPTVILDTIEKYAITGFAGVSSHYVILLQNTDLKNRELPSVRHFMQAGDSMPPWAAREIVRAFPGKKLYLMYGQTEASPRLTYLNPESARHKPTSIGKAIPGVEIKVVDKKGRERPVGTTGEIIAHGDNVMIGYWNNEKETKKAIHDGWLYTGDIGYQDKEGDLFITGRAKGFIKVGANKVNPIDIERLVKEDDRVLEVAAVGMPDSVLGRKAKLYITAAPQQRMKKEDVLELCKSRLPSYMVPSEVEFVDAMPRNSYGKIDKEKLEKS